MRARALPAVPLLGAALLAVSCGGDVLNGEVHKATKAYLRAASDGASVTALYGKCASEAGAGAEPGRVLADEGPGFSFKLTGSVETGGTATVNVTVTGRDGSPSAYNVDLRDEDGTWKVCDVSTGSVSLDVA